MVIGGRGRMGGRMEWRGVRKGRVRKGMGGEGEERDGEGRVGERDGEVR